MLRVVPGPEPLRRRRAFAAVALVLSLLALAVAPRPAHSAAARPSTHAPAADASVANRDLGRVRPVTAKTPTVRTAPAWPKTATLLTDSVALGAADAIRAALPRWQVEVLGKPALMVKQAVPLYLPPDHHVGSVVVVGLGYNSLWENNRKNFTTWADVFDSEADRLVADLRARGASGSSGSPCGSRRCRS